MQADLIRSAHTPVAALAERLCGSWRVVGRQARKLHAFQALGWSGRGTLVRVRGELSNCDWHAQSDMRKAERG